MTTVFVYGTLKQGNYNNRLLKDAKYLGEAQTKKGYRLVHLGYYPGMLRGGKGTVHGELYEVDAETLANLDRLEGHPRHYRREEIEIEGANGTVEGYIHPQGKFLPIPSGKWEKNHPYDCAAYNAMYPEEAEDEEEDFDDEKYDN